jgi:hypothetical protein
VGCCRVSSKGCVGEWGRTDVGTWRGSEEDRGGGVLEKLHFSS